MSDSLLPYSVHSFMLPLRWDYLPKGYTIETGKENVSFEDRTDLNNFLKCILHHNSNWSRKFFRINGNNESFNENHYFHAYATKTLFDLQHKAEKTSRDIDTNKVMVYFEMNIDGSADTYTIKTLNDGEYSLGLSGISLHVYNTGIAILTINVENNRYETKEEILKINEYGRRLYPQFLDAAYPHTRKAKEAFLADSIEMNITAMGVLEDDFSDYDLIEEREVHHYNGNRFERSWVVKVPSYIRQLFGEKFSFILADEKPESIRFNILTDDRMFFQCWYGNNGLASALREIENVKDNSSSATETFEYPHIKDPYWYAYVFGDKKINSSIANKKIQSEHMKIHTYARWSGYGTLYGFSRDSFVAISSVVPTLLANDAPNLRTQMKTIYYQMAVLSLAQRVSVLRFSAEVSNLTDLARSNENKQLSINIKILYKNYLEFINKIYYREITPYIQGIEMYNLAQQVMEIEKHAKGLEQEIDQLFKYVQLEEDTKQSIYAEKLNNIAFLFVPVSLAFSIMSARFFSEKLNWELFNGWDWNSFKWIIIGLLPAIPATVYIIFFKKRK